jgi:transcriptional regulator
MATYCTIQQQIQAHLLARQGWKDEDIAEETKLSLRQVSSEVITKKT